MASISAKAAMSLERFEKVALKLLVDVAIVGGLGTRCSLETVFCRFAANFKVCTTVGAVVSKEVVVDDIRELKIV
jgi:hypothetical protein